MPIDYDSVNDTVTLSVGFNTDIFNSITWKLNDEEQEMDFPKRARDGVTDRERYHKLTFAGRDSFGRIVTASVDVRDELRPHPCQDFIVQEDPLLGRMSEYLDHLRNGENLICSPAGIAFGDGMYYLDAKTAHLIKFEYETETGKIGEHKVLARQDRATRESDLPNAMIIDGDENLWIGFKGNGEVMILSLKNMSEEQTLFLPVEEGEKVVDLTLDENSGDVYVLTEKSLLRVKRR